MLTTSCTAPQAPPPSPPPPLGSGRGASPAPAMRWRVAEQGGVVVLEPERTCVPFEVRYLGPEHPDVGRVVAVEIRVPLARPRERHRFRVQPERAGIRLIDPELVETQGNAPARVQFTSDTRGRARVRVEALE